MRKTKAGNWTTSLELISERGESWPSELDYSCPGEITRVNLIARIHQKNIEERLEQQEEEIQKIKEIMQELLDRPQGIKTIGDRIYQKYRSTLVKEHKGEFVAIDIQEGNIVAIGKSPTEVIEKAKEKSDKRYYIRPIERRIIENE